MDIKRRLVSVLYTVPSDIRFIRKNQRCGNAVHSRSRCLIVMADGGGHHKDIF